MKFKIEISMDNSAFDASPHKELVRILNEIGGHIIAGSCLGSCKDINGNTVGWYEIKP